MSTTEKITIKKNVDRFDEDVRQGGSYAYTAERLSSQLANARISRSIGEAYDFRDKSVLDLGCGDGTYSLELPGFGARRVLGIDPAAEAVNAATEKARACGLGNVVQFEVGDLYALEPHVVNGGFDCVVLRGVLHHLPDAPGALMALAKVAPTIVVLEPNGLNPVLKVLEKVSAYHVAHEERSFTPGQLRRWLQAAGFRVTTSAVLNLVPMFCPNWMARPLRLVEPAVEQLPGLRDIACGQILLVGAR
jgi:2-polyprenyl-3-methyl-5-hydroxy-6-metoxy-1,4-benzoquinol methylase